MSDSPARIIRPRFIDDGNAVSPALAPDWRPDSWQHRPAAQQPNYPDAEALQAALGQLRNLPPLVTSWE
ncbi:MAG TPA: 3-deoxy-7-phosphoheptulonate synthase, partial [Solimonas sp.]